MHAPALPLGLVLLVGGRSRRMGRDKAHVEFGGEPLSLRALRRLAPLGGPRVVVRAPGQALPALPPDVACLTDRLPGEGPLPALAQGLAAIAGDAELAFACPTDTPLVSPGLPLRLAALLGGHDAAIPRLDGHLHATHGVYRTACATRLAAHVDAGARRLGGVTSVLDVREVTREELLADASLAAEDPSLDGLFDVDTELDLEALARRAATRDPRRP